MLRPPLPMPRRFPVAIFLFAFFGWTFDFYDLVLLGFIKDGVARDLHLSHAAASWLLGAGLGASGVGGLAAGALADRFGKRRLLSVTVLIYSVGWCRGSGSAANGRSATACWPRRWRLPCGVAPRRPCRSASRSASRSPRSSATWCCRAWAGARC